MHFPTGLNLLWGSLRKCPGIVERLQGAAPVKGWRKIKDLRKGLKSIFRATSQQVFKGKNEHRKKTICKAILAAGKDVGSKVHGTGGAPACNSRRRKADIGTYRGA